MRKLKKSVKVKAKKILLTGILAIGMSYLLAEMVTSSIVTENDVTMKEVVVNEGDTVWNLVKKENKHYSGDLRDLTYFVEEGYKIHPGQTIEIPVYKNK